MRNLNSEDETEVRKWQVQVVCPPQQHLKRHKMSVGRGDHSRDRREGTDIRVSRDQASDFRCHDLITSFRVLHNSYSPFFETVSFLVARFVVAFFSYESRFKTVYLKHKKIMKKKTRRRNVWLNISQLSSGCQCFPS